MLDRGGGGNRCAGHTLRGASGIWASIGNSLPPLSVGPTCLRTGLLREECCWPVHSVRSAPGHCRANLRQIWRGRSEPRRWEQSVSAQAEPIFIHRYHGGRMALRTGNRAVRLFENLVYPPARRSRQGLWQGARMRASKEPGAFPNNVKLVHLVSCRAPAHRKRRSGRQAVAPFPSVVPRTGVEPARGINPTRPST